jgi:hypothetical protein
MIWQGHATRPITWFEPSHKTPPEQCRDFFIGARGVPKPSTPGSRNPFLISILQLLHTHTWVNATVNAPLLFQEDLKQLVQVYSPKVIDPKPTKTPSLIRSQSQNLSAPALPMLSDCFNAPLDRSQISQRQIPPSCHAGQNGKNHAQQAP